MYVFMYVYMMALHTLSAVGGTASSACAAWSTTTWRPTCGAKPRT